MDCIPASRVYSSASRRRPNQEYPLLRKPAKCNADFPRPRILSHILASVNRRLREQTRESHKYYDSELK